MQKSNEAENRKIDATVLKETRYITGIVLILSVVMELIFIVIGKWDYTVLLGNILSAVGAVVNFLLMGITIQNALGKEEKDARTLMKFSQKMRLFMLFAVAAVGILLKCFNTWTVIIPMFFPRIGVQIRPLFDKKKNENAE